MSSDDEADMGDENQLYLPLIFTHLYDGVEINSSVPWDELSDSTQLLAQKVVDYYRMQASIKVDAQIDIKAINLEGNDSETGMLFSLIATVDPLGDNEIDYESLFDIEKTLDDDDE